MPRNEPVLQSSHDYMEEWLPKRRTFLTEVIEHEAPSGDICSKCKGSRFKFRCLDCLYSPLLCLGCCREIHQSHPFHRIEVWKDNHFAPAWLWQLGVQVHLGHGGNVCPFRKPQEPVDAMIEPIPMAPNYIEGTTELDDDDSETEDTGQEYGWSANKPPNGYCPGATSVVFVHTNAVHHLPVFLCDCPGAKDPIAQYLELGFYPATYKQIETVFTFQVLDDYLLSNLECHTSCHHYYAKLRRMTNRVFPKSVPVSPSPLNGYGKLNTDRIVNVNCLVLLDNGGT